MKEQRIALLRAAQDTIAEASAIIGNNITEADDKTVVFGLSQVPGAGNHEGDTYTQAVFVGGDKDALVRALITAMGKDKEIRDIIRAASTSYTINNLFGRLGSEPCNCPACRAERAAEKQ